MDLKYRAAFLTPCLTQDSQNQLPEASAKSTSLEHLPVEIHVKILSFVDLMDVLSYATTCKYFYRCAESQLLWKVQWIKFSQKTPFSFLPTASMTDLGVNFRDTCKRLWKVLISESIIFGGGLNPVKCCYCREFTCNPTCIEERRGLKAAIDIGGKITKIIRGDFRQESHSSMVAIPKVLKCYDCDKTFSREEVFSQQPSDYCQRSGSSGSGIATHSLLEFRSQALVNLAQNPPFCLFCDQDRTNDSLSEREIVYRAREKMNENGDRMQYFSSLTEEDFRNHESLLPLINGYCKDTSDILKAENLDLLSPLLALEHVESIPIVKSFLSHLLLQHKFVEFIQRPNNALILTIPSKIPHRVKEWLLKFFFEETKASRICLLPKALAVAQLFRVSTCIVVDSGATSTHVWVVIDGQVQEARSQSLNVGGWHVSQCLKQAVNCDLVSLSFLKNSQF